MSKISALKRAALRRERQDDEATQIGSELAVAMIQRSVPRSVIERLGRPGPYGLILIAPRPEHVGMISDALDDLLGEKCRVFTLSAIYPPSRPRQSVEALRAGEVAVVVTPSLHLVPDAFRHHADATVRIEPHDATIIRRTLRNLVGPRVPRFPPGFKVHPDPEQIVGSIMLDLPIGKIVAALDRLGRTMGNMSSDRLPDLADAVEFGEAQRWGLQVAADVAAWRAGSLPAEDLDLAALLVGPPGYGKTFFAKVLAASMNAPLFEITIGSIFQGEGHLGDVLKALRRQFEEAASAAPSVLIIDELDSFSRRDVRDNNQSFTASVINELLTLLDGVSARRPGMVVIGSTNLPDAIEPALRRPGRISRTIEMALPNAAGREHVMRFHLRDELTSEPIDEAVRLSKGLTCARLMEVTRMARQSARSLGRAMVVADLVTAIAGDRSTEDMHLLRRVAVHEAGHAVACLALQEAPILRSVSILPEGSSLGRVRTRERDGPNTLSRGEAKVTMLLAGRAAEMVVHGHDLSDGAASDLQVATDAIVRMHAQLGLYGDLAHHANPERLLSIDPVFAKKVNAILLRLMADALEMLAERRPEIIALADELVARRLLTAAEAEAIVLRTTAKRRPTDGSGLVAASP